MRALTLDYHAISGRKSWAAWGLLLAGLLLCADLGRTYWQTISEVAQREAVLRGLDRAQSKDRQALSRQYGQEEFVAAQEVIDRLAVPWESLFAAIESVDIPGIVLHELEPDPHMGVIKLTGEATDYPVLLSYVEGLSQAKPLHEVYLQRHEMSSEGGLGVSFVILAHWRGK